MTEYRVFSERRHDRENGEYEAFGVAAVESGEVVFSVGDITDDREKINALVTLFNEEELSPLHLENAIEDFLYDLEV